MCVTAHEIMLQWLFSAVLLGLTAARLHYTTHLPRGDPLNQGQPFYGTCRAHSSDAFHIDVDTHSCLSDPIVAELLACSILAMVWAPLV